MQEKIYCSQCHHSVFRPSSKTSQIEIYRRCSKCLYCYKRKRYFAYDRLIGGCRYLLPEDREKYFSGIWDANVSNSEKEK